MQLPAGAVDYRVIPAPRRPGRGTWWEQMQLRRAVAGDAPDALFAPAYSAPLLSGAPLALTIHDISFVAHPEWFRMREGVRRRWMTRRSAQAAAVIFTDSEFSRSEIHSHFHIERSRIQVIPPGVARPGGAGARRHFAEREPLILYAGSIFTRRRVPDLIAAFAHVARDIPAARLVVVGEDRSWPPLSLADVASAHGVASRVELRNYVEDEELARLYERASVFAFLSEYEGFGLTPLEALAAGVPIVVLDTPVAREIYADAAFYVAPGDIQATAGVLTRVMRDRASANAAMQHAPAVLARYSWDRSAAQTLEHIERIARR
jgi:glycosyltransferase involved in cell wall biosynthesis